MLNYSNNAVPEKPHFNVAITTPGNQMCSEYVKCLMATVFLLNENNISWIYQNESSPIVSNAREATITGSTDLQVFNPHPGKGGYTYDKIFMIDSDIVWNPDQFMNFLQSDKDFISGIYFESTGSYAMVHRNKNEQRPLSREEIVELQKDDKMIEVYGVGLGFCCVKSGVFESLKRPWFKLGSIIQEVDGVEYHIPVGEDLFFCERVAEAGHKIFIDPKMIVGHVKRNIVC